jgi:hypothetical protein
VKTNIVHTLFWVQKYGLMSIDQFNGILSPSDLKRCKKSQKKTWYSLPLNVFTNFTFQVISYFDLVEKSFFWIATGFVKFQLLFQFRNMMPPSISYSFDSFVFAFLFSLCAA